MPVNSGDLIARGGGDVDGRKATGALRPSATNDEQSWNRSHRNLADHSALTAISRSPLRDVMFGACLFIFAGPLIAALIFSSLMLLVWTIQGSPLGETLALSLRMIPMIYVGSFFFLFFIPAGITGAVMGWIGARFRRYRTAWLSVVVSLLVAMIYVSVRAWLLDLSGPNSLFSGMDAIAIGNAPIPSWLLGWWMYPRLKSREQ